MSTVSLVLASKQKSLLNANMRFIVLAMLIGCALAASVDRVRRDGNDEGSSESLNREMRVRRDAPKECSFQKWDNGVICYDFGDGVKPNIEAMYMKVFNRLMDVSCVEFVHSSESACDDVKAIPVQVIEQENGCWAHVGCSYYQRTTISMAGNCYSYGVILHEVFHALGRFHEQTRQDRDENLIVHLENIIDNKEGNYEKCTRELFGVDYDFQSIMHYSDQHFIKPGKNATMTIIDEHDKYNQKLMGLQGKLSFKDIETVNKMYSCYGSTTDIHCAHGGIKTDKGKCLCSLPFTGDNCEEVDSTKGVEFAIEYDDDVINSVDFPGKYPADTNMFYVLQCQSGKQVNVNFEKFSIEAYGCGYDFFQDFVGEGDIYAKKMCGTTLKGKTIKSKGDYMVIYLYSDDVYQYQGFEGKLSCV